MSNRAGRYTVAAVDPWSTQATGGVALDEDGDAVAPRNPNRGGPATHDGEPCERCGRVRRYVHTGECAFCTIRRGATMTGTQGGKRRRHHILATCREDGGVVDMGYETKAELPGVLAELRQEWGKWFRFSVREEGGK